MTSREITGIFVSAHKLEAKYAIRRKVSPFHERYDVHKPWNKIDVVRSLVKLLDGEFEDFLQRFEAVDTKHYRSNSHRARHYVSSEQEKLYPNKDFEFCKRFSFQYKDRWIATNIGAKEIIQCVREMCEACDVAYGSWADLRL